MLQETDRNALSKSIIDEIVIVNYAIKKLDIELLNQLADQLYYELYSQSRNQLRNQLNNQFWDQLDDQLTEFQNAE